MNPSGTAPAIARGWKEIARALGVSETTAKALAKREREPLPVRVGHRGVYAYLSRLQDWVDAEDVAYARHRAELRGRRQASL